MCADKHLVAMAAAERLLAEQEQLAPETDWPLMRLASRLLSDQVAVEGVIVVDKHGQSGVSTRKVFDGRGVYRER